MKLTRHLTNHLGYVANLFCLWSYVAPLPKFYEIVKKRTVKDFSLNPYLASVFNCGKCVLYGLPFFPYNINFLAVSIVGLVMQFIYIIVYLIYADKEERRYVLDVLAIETAVYSILVSSLTFCLEQATAMEKSTVVGIHGILSNIYMQKIMPLSDVMSKIKTRSVENLPVYLLVTNFVNSGIWFVLFGFNHFIVLTSGLASVLALIQLILHTYYNNSMMARNADGNPAEGNTLQTDFKDEKQE